MIKEDRDYWFKHGGTLLVNGKRWRLYPLDCESLIWFSEDGDIYNSDTGHYSRGSINSRGYRVYTYRNCVTGKMAAISVHRAVAELFIPNPQDLPEINHKDENKLNNSVSNLEWCTSKYNVNYGTRNKRHSIAMIKRLKKNVK